MNEARPTERPWTQRLEAQLVFGFLLAALLPVTLVAGLLSWQGRQMATSFVSEHVQKTAEAYAAGLDLFIERHRGHLRELASSGADDALLAATVEAEPGLVDLWFHVEPAEAGARAAWAEAACAAMADGSTAHAEHAGEGHAHEVVIAVSSGGRTLCGQISFTPHQQMMAQQADSFLGGSAYIVDRSGAVVCYAFDDAHPHVARGDVLSSTVARVAGEGRSWSGTVNDEGTPRFAAFAIAQDLPWGVWVDVPKDSAFAPFQREVLRGATLVTLISLVAAGLAVTLGRRLGAPVRSLAETAGRLAAGELGASVDVKGPAEIAALAEEFNKMSGALAASHAELEDRVATRTRELAQARAFSDRLLDTMRQRILVIDPGEHVVRANRAALDAYGSSVIGCGCQEVPGTDDSHTSQAAEVMRTGLPLQEERTLVRNGRTEVLAVETVPLQDDDGLTIGALEIGQDITELRRIGTRLAQQEKMAAVGTLAAGLAHEIGNPLASMSSELEMLERLWDPEDARNALPVLRDQVRRMTGLLRELIDVGRPGSDQAGRFAPKTVLDEVARLLSHDPRGRTATLRVEAPPELEICTSRDRLVQVLVNLGLNALDAAGEHGTVTLRAWEAAHQELRIQVEDDGPGIAEEAHARVFDPFYTSKPPGQGTGLGLFVSERIIEGLGGRIELDRGDAGARFTLVLPDCCCKKADA